MASTTPADFGRSPWRSRRCPPPRCSWTGKSPRLMSTLLSRRAFLHPDPHALVTPPIYIAFDCVHASGRDLRDHPLGARREVVERLIGDQHLLFPACCLPAHGLAAWAEVQRRGYEGLVAKDETAAYRSGLSPGRMTSRRYSAKCNSLPLIAPNGRKWVANQLRSRAVPSRTVPGASSRPCCASTASGVKVRLRASPSSISRMSTSSANAIALMIWPRWSSTRYSMIWSARCSSDGGIVKPS